jgi:hypothetical protein
MSVDVRMACVNTYALTLTNVMKMANTTACIEKHRAYKARILREKKVRSVRVASLGDSVKNAFEALLLECSPQSHHKKSD